VTNPLETLSGHEPHTSYEEHARRLLERLAAEKLAAQQVGKVIIKEVTHD